LAKNDKRVQLKSNEILGKKLLILGETGSGKTKLLAEILQELTWQVDPEEITVIDLAPQRTGEIGGKLTDYLNIDSRVRYLSPEKVYTPRLAGTSPEQVLRYAKLNKKSMEPLLNRFVRNVTRVLMLNDITLYLHLGELQTVLECVRLADTFSATAYHGSRFDKDFGTGISVRERQMTEELAAFMDSIVRIN